MNRKLAFASLGLLGVLGFGNIARCFDKEETSEGCSLEQKVEAAEPVATKTTNFQTDAEKLNQIDPNYRLTAEELIFLTRIIYFEEGSFGYGQSNGFSVEETKKGYESIASVLLNRYEFDTQNNYNKFHRKDSNGSLITYAKYDHAFSCLKKKKKYFDNDTFRDENGKLTLGFDEIDTRSIEQVYESLIGVISKEIDDPTNSALYYKTIELGKKRKVVWHNKEAFWLNKKSCKIDWKMNITNHQYYGINCGVD